MLNLFKPKSKLARTFHHIFYKTNWWKTNETGSGPGSSLANTEKIRKQIPLWLRSLQVNHILDAPCGDFNWMSRVDLGQIRYTGADIIPKLIRRNKKKYPGVEFIVADITVDPLPPADLVLCRDCFIHLPNYMILASIANFKRAGIRYLLTNTYHFIQENNDILPGDFRMINLELPPFSLPAPEFIMDEEYTSGFPDKKLALWKL